MPARRIHLNAFAINSAVHMSAGLWRHPDDRSTDYTHLRHWTDLARLLERGIFDGLFLADTLGAYDVYGGSAAAALSSGVHVPIDDPMVLVPAMAAVTEHLGFGVTASVAFDDPYSFARRASTLDHLTGGRFGWNVVTGFVDSAARARGQGHQLPHDRRYDRADEYLEVAYQLWEGSWEDDAVVHDRERGLFADPDKVHEIEHHGEFFEVRGIHQSEPSPQRPPVIYQAGSSPRGQRFAAENAEAIFVSAPTADVLTGIVANTRAALSDAGRDPYRTKIYQMHTVITGETAAAARATHADLVSYVDVEGSLANFSAALGVDLSQFPRDRPLNGIESDGIRTALALFELTDPDAGQWTLGDIAQWFGIGGPSPVCVGSPGEVADELQSWVDRTDVDGFNLTYALMPGTFTDVVEHLVPELQRRGAYPTEYTHGTLRHKLFGRGDRLPPEHRGSAYRRR